MILVFRMHQSPRLEKSVLKGLSLKQLGIKTLCVFCRHIILDFPTKSDYGGHHVICHREDKIFFGTAAAAQKQKANM
jgi:hypothetical protein